MLLIGSIHVRSRSSVRSVTDSAAAVGLPLALLRRKGLLCLCTPTEPITPVARVRRQRDPQVRRVQFFPCPCVVRERRLGWPGQRRGRANRVRSQRSSAELPLLRHSGGSPASSCRHGVPTATVAAGLRCRRGIPGLPKVGGLRATWLRLAKHLCSWLGCTPRSSRRVWQGSTKTEVP